MSLPKLAKAQDIVQLIFQDLENAKKYVHNPVKLNAKCASLVFLIVSTMRKSVNDPLLQTNVVWALISLFRLDPPSVKNMMLANGVPGILFEILSR